MIKVSDIVVELIERDEVALESLRAGLLNLSAYAEKIHRQVENATKKPVKKGTIVVALSRASKSLAKTTPLLPDVRLTNLRITSSLAILSYPKTPEIQRKVSVLHPFTLAVQDMFSLTEGPAEVTIVCSEKAKEKLLRHFGGKAKATHNDVVAVTCAFDEKMVGQPNVFYVLFSALAAKRTVILQIVSTATEITFLVKQDDMEQTLAVLNTYFSKGK